MWVVARNMLAMVESVCLCLGSCVSVYPNSIGGYYRQLHRPSRIESGTHRVEFRRISLLVRRVDQFDDY